MSAHAGDNRNEIFSAATKPARIESLSPIEMLLRTGCTSRVAHPAKRGTVPWRDIGQGAGFEPLVNMGVVHASFFKRIREILHALMKFLQVSFGVVRFLRR